MNEMIEQTGTAEEFDQARDTDQMNEAVASLEAMGATWMLFQGKGLEGYVAAQFTSGGSAVKHWWVTPEGMHPVAAWDLALAFITARVREDLVAEWGSPSDSGTYTDACKHCGSLVREVGGLLVISEAEWKAGDQLHSRDYCPASVAPVKGGVPAHEIAQATA